MKKLISLLLVLILCVPFVALFAHADPMPVQCCITWKYFPTQKSDSREIIKSSYIAEMHYSGDEIPWPERIPEYSRDGVDYIFIGWKLAELQDIKNYWDDPSLGFTPATFEQEELLTIMPNTDVNYLALYYKPLRGDLNFDGLINITDVTILLNHLSSQDAADNAAFDIDESGASSISDVTALLDLLS